MVVVLQNTEQRQKGNVVKVNSTKDGRGTEFIITNKKSKTHDHVVVSAKDGKTTYHTNHPNKGKKK